MKLPSITIPFSQSIAQCAVLTATTLALGRITKLQPISPSKTFIATLPKALSSTFASEALALGTVYGANRVVKYLFGQPLKQLHSSLPVALTVLGIMTFVSLATPASPSSSGDGATATLTTADTKEGNSDDDGASEAPSALGGLFNRVKNMFAGSVSNKDEKSDDASVQSTTQGGTAPQLNNATNSSQGADGNGEATDIEDDA